MMMMMMMMMMIIEWWGYAEQTHRDTFDLYFVMLTSFWFDFYKSLFHHTMVDKNEKYRKTNLTNDRKTQIREHT